MLHVRAFWSFGQTWWGGEVAGGGGAAAAAGSIQRAAAEAKGEKGSERAESLQPHVDVTAKARPDPAALVSPFRCWCFLANDCDRLGGLPMPSSPSQWRSRNKELGGATFGNLGAKIINSVKFTIHLVEILHGNGGQ